MSQPADTVRAAIRTLKDLGDAVHATVNDAVSSADRDQIAERLRDLPFQAVRLAVAGVGQAIALADKVQNLIEEQARDGGDKKETEPARRPEGHAGSSGRNGSVVAMPQHNGGDEAARAQRATARRAERPARSVPERTTPQAAAPKAAAPKPAAPKAAAPKAAAPKAAAPKAAAPKAATPKKPAAKKTDAKSSTGTGSTAKSGTAKSGAAKSGVNKSATAADLPVPDYDSASLASVRARLRNLTQADLRKLRSYEKSHAARPEFITLYDNRLAKLRDSNGS
jgi:hypothetical protein